MASIAAATPAPPTPKAKPLLILTEEVPLTVLLALAPKVLTDKPPPTAATVRPSSLPKFTLESIFKEVLPLTVEVVSPPIATAAPPLANAPILAVGPTLVFTLPLIVVEAAPFVSNDNKGILFAIFASTEILPIPTAELAPILN